MLRYSVLMKCCGVCVQADIDCMRDHVMRGIKWHYLINVAGQSYPLRTPEEMVDILRIYNGANDIEGIYNRRIFTRYKRVTISIISSICFLSLIINH